MGNIATTVPAGAGAARTSLTPDDFNRMLEAVVLDGMGAAAPDRYPKVAVKTIGGAALQAGVLAWVNPEASAIVITRIVFDRTTKSTGASTVDIGTTPTSITTESDNLIDGLDAGATEAVADNLQNAGTNGKQLQKLAAGKWVTFKSKTGDTTGLVAVAYIHYSLI